jgi:tRNA(Ile)-lysidine synthase
MTKSSKQRQSSPKSAIARKYPASLSRFARSLLRECRKLKLGDRGDAVVVAVSGGADSVALFLGLDELVRAGKIDVEIVVAHLNHKLRGAASDADARWVKSLAKGLGHRAVIRSSDIKARARKSKDNLEQAARRGRYEFLGHVAKSHKAGFVLTAHTMNDQAETILLNLIRGSGADGLGGIEPLRALMAGSDIVLARPLLSWAHRADTEGFCRSKLVNYREDQMNLDENFTRVRVRRELLPLLERFNPRFIETVTRSAEILRDDSLALEAAARRLLDLASGQDDGRAGELRTDLLLVAPSALRRRALRQWLSGHRGDLRRIEHAHVVAIEKLLMSPKSGRAVELPGGATAFRKEGVLHFRLRQKASMT